MSLSLRARKRDDHAALATTSFWWTDVDRWLRLRFRKKRVLPQVHSRSTGAPLDGPPPHPPARPGSNSTEGSDVDGTVRAGVVSPPPHPEDKDLPRVDRRRWSV